MCQIRLRDSGYANYSFNKTLCNLAGGYFIGPERTSWRPFDVCAKLGNASISGAMVNLLVDLLI